MIGRFLCARWMHRWRQISEYPLTWDCRRPGCTLVFTTHMYPTRRGTH